MYHYILGGWTGLDWAVLERNAGSSNQSRTNADGRVGEDSERITGLEWEGDGDPITSLPKSFTQTGRVMNGHLLLLPGPFGHRQSCQRRRVSSRPVGLPLQRPQTAESSTNKLWIHFVAQVAWIALKFIAKNFLSSQLSVKSAIIYLMINIHLA